MLGGRERECRVATGCAGAFLDDLMNIWETFSGLQSEDGWTIGGVEEDSGWWGVGGGGLRALLLPRDVSFLEVLL